MWLSESRNAKTPRASPPEGSSCYETLAYTAPTSGASQLRRDDKLVNRAVPAEEVRRVVLG